MTRLFYYISLFFLAVLLTGCSKVLQTVDLNLNSKDSSLQEEFNVIEKTLTIKEAKTQKSAPYSRIVLKNGRGKNAQPISEQLALRSEFPKNNSPIEYKIGIGDTITFSRLIENIVTSLKNKNLAQTERSNQIQIGNWRYYSFNTHQVDR